MILPTEEIKNLVDELAKYASSFADYDEADYLIRLRDRLRLHAEATYGIYWLPSERPASFQEAKDK